MSIRKFTSSNAAGLAVLTMAALLTMTALFATAARAAVRHEFLSTLVSEVPAAGPHGEVVSQPGRLSEPRAMTVDDGTLYVAELAGAEFKSRLDSFDASSGAFIEQFASVPAEAYDFRQGLAVGHGTGETEVYDVGDEHTSGVPQGLIAVYGSTGALQAEWTGIDTPSKGFGCFECHGSGGVAVDDSTSLNDWAAGEVYVADPENRVVDVFRPKAGGGEEYATQLTGPEPGVAFHEPRGVAVNQLNGDVSVLDGQEVDSFEPTALEKYSSLGRVTGTPQGPFTNVEGLAVDGGSGEGNGDLYVLDYGAGAIDQFDASGKYLGQVTSTPAGPLRNEDTDARPDGVTVDPATHELYVGAHIGEGGKGGVIYAFGPDIVLPDAANEPVSELAPRSVTLNGTVNPNSAGPAKCQFEWGTSPALGSEVACAAEVAQGASSVAVHASLSGLLSGTTYYYRLRASNANGTTLAPTASQFRTPGPGIVEQSSSDVAATSATLAAVIDPHGSPTTFYFQYGTGTGYGGEVPAPPGAAVGSGEGGLEVSRHLQNLLPGTVYHYRVVAVSEPRPGVSEAFEGADQTFTTQPVGSGFTLPDGRQWEMVSAPEKFGAPLEPIGPEWDIQAAANGDALVYVAESPTEAAAPGFNESVFVLGLRGSSGWHSTDISAPHANPPGKELGNGKEYRFFSEDLSLGILQPFGGFTPSLSSEASEQTAFLRTDFFNGDVNEPCGSSCYRPLVTGTPGSANVPPGTRFGEEGRCGQEGEGVSVCGPEFVGATPDLSHVVLQSPFQLTADAEVGGGLYEWSAGRLFYIGSGRLGQEELTARNAISADGSRVFFKGSSEGLSGLLMRDVSSGETLKLDASQGGVGSKGASEFQIASADGSRVFFTSSERLTNDAASGGPALYECQIVELAGQPHCTLSDLTPGSATENANVQAVIGASDDGSYVYFVAGGMLAEGAVHGACLDEEEATSGTCNLYVRHDGTTKLVAVLSDADFPLWRPAQMAADVSSNGRWLAFMSQQSLSGSVTRDAVSGRRDQEVYLYDAQSERLVCASCNPTGARPVGATGDIEDSLVESNDDLPENRWLAATIPGWTPFRLSESRYRSRVLSDGGRLFFNSHDALAPQDVNGTWDVYEYEPPGEGDCASASATFSPRTGGCVAMISSGTSAEQSAFLDASANGNDVFFLTQAKLSEQDIDTSLDVYDAHVCTAEAPCFPVASAKPPPCDTGDACKPAPTPQPAIFGAPSSSTFSGAGNIVPAAPATGVKARSLTRAQKLAKALRSCGGRPKAKRAMCRRRARARYATNRSRKASATKKGRG